MTVLCVSACFFRGFACHLLCEPWVFCAFVALRTLCVVFLAALLLFFNGHDVFLFSVCFAKFSVFWFCLLFCTLFFQGQLRVLPCFVY